jgi:hypothetical protein
MKNRKLIVINGLTRGGTNILWNIVQSHPSVCATFRETTDNFTPGRWRFMRPVVMRVLGSPVLLVPPLDNLAGSLLDSVFYRSKMYNVGDDRDGFKYEGVPYTREEVENSILCLKSINRDNFLNDLLARTYGAENIYFVAIVRDGYALCHSWVSRGGTAERTGQRYRTYVQRMFDDSEKFPHHIMVRFEDVLQDPFSIAKQVYSFAGLDPVELPKLRLKPKPIVGEDGKRYSPYGDIKKKYWFDQETVGDILVRDIGSRQKDLLSDEDLRSFEREAKPVLERLEYT